MIRRRGFNIDSLSVGPTEDGSVSRMTIAVHVGRQQAEQATKQLSKLIDVITIEDITELRNVSHELLLIRMNAPPSQRTELLQVVAVFLGRIVDIASSSMIIEVTGHHREDRQLRRADAPLRDQGGGPQRGGRPGARRSGRDQPRRPGRWSGEAVSRPAVALAPPASPPTRQGTSSARQNPRRDHVHRPSPGAGGRTQAHRRETPR